jgi:hypothetical protein
MPTLMTQMNRPGACRFVLMLDWAVAVLLLTVVPGLAQDTTAGNLNPLENRRGGFHLYNVTGFAGWESVASPYGSGYLLPSTSGLGADGTYGAAATVGWSRPTGRSNISLTYTASYLGRFRYSQWNALNHFLNLNASRQLSRKWNVGLSGTSVISSYDQLLFDPTRFGSLSATPGSFQDLASAVLAGKYNNDQLASLLTGAPVIESPSRTLFFGNRVFSNSAMASLSYAPSERLSFQFSTGVSETQHLQDKGQAASQYPYLIPHATYGTASVGASYALSPKTQVGVSMSSSRGFSRIENAYTTYGTAYVGRTIGRHWFARAYGGAGFVTVLNSRYAASDVTRPVAGASLGYRSYANTLMGAYDRTLGQSYGIGAADTTMISAAWHWWRPGRTWGLTSNYGKEQLRNSVFGDVDGWRAGLGATRMLGRHATIETEYSYASYIGRTGLAPYSSDQSAVRLSVSWVPEAVEKR